MSTIDSTTADHAARTVLAVLDADRDALLTVLADVADAPEVAGVDPITRLIAALAHDVAALFAAQFDGNRDAVRDAIRAGILERAAKID